MSARRVTNLTDVTHKTNRVPGALERENRTGIVGECAGSLPRGPTEGAVAREEKDPAKITRVRPHGRHPSTMQDNNNREGGRYSVRSGAHR